MFYRIDDMYALDGPEFFKLAFRVAAYSGNLAMKIQYQQHEQQEQEKKLHQGDKSLYEATKARYEKAGMDRKLGTNKPGQKVRMVPLASQMVTSPDLFEVAKV